MKEHFGIDAALDSSFAPPRIETQSAIAYIRIKVYVET